MPQTVPKFTGLSPSFDYSTFQFDLSLLSDDCISTNSTSLVSSHLQIECSNPKSFQIKQKVCSSRPTSSTHIHSSPLYSSLNDEILPNYSVDASSVYTTNHYYISQSPRNAQLHPTTPQPIITFTKQPATRNKTFDLLSILQESKFLTESLDYKEDCTDCTVPCTPPQTETDIYNSLDTDFFPKKEKSNPLLKEILFKEDNRLSLCSSRSISSLASTCSSSSIASSPIFVLLDSEKSSLHKLISLDASRTLQSKDRNQENSIFTRANKSTENCSLKEMLENESQFKEDHQLLREVLRDTSFQRKYNLKPVNLGTVEMSLLENMVESGDCVGGLAREQIESVLNLAIQQLQKDFDNTCVALGIHPEPRRWSAADVAAWVQWAKRQLQLPSVSLDSFNVDGITLTNFTEDEFCQRAPECGSMLYAQLEIWKTAVEESPRNTLATSWTPTAVIRCSENENNTPSIINCISDSLKGSYNIDYSDDEDEGMTSTEINIRSNTNSNTRNNGSHIHLWQFLKELLQSSSVHGSCIRWLDRNKGVFKIEDSVRVAQLWGKRKNRPAMNYDKLSRSIRQYYKKGIMKKTERSQRLVYQFCHPYCL